MQHGCCIRAYKDVFTASLRESYIARNATIYVERKTLNETTTEALAKKVMHWCDQLAAISSNPENISRFYLTPEHKRCNTLVAQWMQEAGMETWVDAAGNLCGHYDAQDAC